MEKHFPVIDLSATGKNISRLRKERGLSVRDLQSWFGFEEPQAIYKWQWGKSLPSVDNLLALSTLFEVPIDAILVTDPPKFHMADPQCASEATAPTGVVASFHCKNRHKEACSLCRLSFLLSHAFEYDRNQCPCTHFLSVSPPVVRHLIAPIPERETKVEYN